MSTHTDTQNRGQSLAVPAPTEGARSEAAPRRTVQPHVDIHRSKEELLVVAELPGVTREGLSILVEDGQLSITGQRAQRDDSLLSGGAVVDYHRAFRLPKSIDTTRIEAELRNGLLHLHLPLQDELRPRRIPVRS